MFFSFHSTQMTWEIESDIIRVTDKRTWCIRLTGDFIGIIGLSCLFTLLKVRLCTALCFFNIYTLISFSTCCWRCCTWPYSAVLRCLVNFPLGEASTPPPSFDHTCTSVFVCPCFTAVLVQRLCYCKRVVPCLTLVATRKQLSFSRTGTNRV